MNDCPGIKLKFQASGCNDGCEDVAKTAIVGCSGSRILAEKVARRLGVECTQLETKKFPDGETYLKFLSPASVKSARVILFQGLARNPDNLLMELIFAASTAADLGAGKIIAVIPYLAYTRQDRRFHPGECLSSRIVSGLVEQSGIEEVYTVDPHLHRFKSLREIFSVPAHPISSVNAIADYIKRNFKGNFKVDLFIGPDEESYQWARAIAERLGSEAVILEKERYSATKVKVKMAGELNLKGKKVMIVDDIISTGGTMAGAAVDARKAGAAKIYGVGIHAILAAGALEKLRRAGISKVVATNTVDSRISKVDVSGEIAGALSKTK